MKTQITGIAIALIVGGIGGYLVGGSGTNSDDYAKREKESIVMMKDQAATIKKMAEIMKTGGTMMQTMGMQYKNEEAVTTGKDLEMMGSKYISTASTTGSNSMNQMMGK